MIWQNLQNQFQFKAFFNIFNERQFFSFENDESMLFLLCALFLFDPTWTWCSSLCPLDLYICGNPFFIYSRRDLYCRGALLCYFISMSYKHLRISLFLIIDEEMPVSVFFWRDVYLDLCTNSLSHHVHLPIKEWQLGSKIKDLCLPGCSLYSAHCTFESSKHSLSQLDDEAKETNFQEAHRIWIDVHGKNGRRKVGWRRNWDPRFNWEVKLKAESERRE